MSAAYSPFSLTNLLHSRGIMVRLKALRGATRQAFRAAGPSSGTAGIDLAAFSRVLQDAGVEWEVSEDAPADTSALLTQYLNGLSWAYDVGDVSRALTAKTATFPHDARPGTHPCAEAPDAPSNPPCSWRAYDVYAYEPADAGAPQPLLGHVFVCSRHNALEVVYADAYDERDLEAFHACMAHFQQRAEALQDRGWITPIAAQRRISHVLATHFGGISIVGDSSIFVPNAYRVPGVALPHGDALLESDPARLLRLLEAVASAWPHALSLSCEAVYADIALYPFTTYAEACRGAAQHASSDFRKYVLKARGLFKAPPHKHRVLLAWQALERFLRETRRVCFHLPSTHLERLLDAGEHLARIYASWLKGFDDDGAQSQVLVRAPGALEQLLQGHDSWLQLLGHEPPDDLFVTARPRRITHVVPDP